MLGVVKLTREMNSRDSEDMLRELQGKVNNAEFMGNKPRTVLMQNVEIKNRKVKFTLAFCDEPSTTGGKYTYTATDFIFVAMPNVEAVQFTEAEFTNA